MGRFLSQAFSPRRQEKQQMSQKSANMARRLFADQTGQSAAGGRDGRCVMGDENSVRNNSLASDAMRPRMMRIRFGLILKITVWTKSYAPFTLQYFIKQPDSRAKLSLFSGSHPNYSIRLNSGTYFAQASIAATFRRFTGFCGSKPFRSETS